MSFALGTTSERKNSRGNSSRCARHAKICRGDGEGEGEDVGQIGIADANRPNSYNPGSFCRDNTHSMSYRRAWYGDASSPPRRVFVNRNRHIDAATAASIRQYT